MTKTINHIIGRKLNILLVKIMEYKNVTLVSDKSNETAPNLAGSSMTKAGRLAMELSHEKKRLKQELEELQTEYDEIKPTTPIESHFTYQSVVPVGVVGLISSYSV